MGSTFWIVLVMLVVAVIGSAPEIDELSGQHEESPPADPTDPKFWEET